MIQIVETRNPELVSELRTKLHEELKKITIPKLPKLKELKPGQKHIYRRSDVVGDIGRSMNFGYGNTRRGVKDFKSNGKYPDLMKALVDYGNAVLPVGFHYNGITVNHNVKAKKHIDCKNNGVSYITGFGIYTGGELTIYKSETEVVEMDLHNKVVGFNGSELYHETKDFEGDRYTIIYYKQIWDGYPSGYDTVGK
jgi:hypothetical protein